MEALTDISYGMYVICTKYNDKNVGCIVNTVSQVTAVNPIISVSINKQNYTNEAIKKNRFFAISIVSENFTKEHISKFGFFSSKDINKFENITYELIENIPVVTQNMCSYAICEVIDVIDANTHDIFLAKVITTKKLNNYTPMTYKYYHEQIKGKAPATAPTFVEETNVSNSEKYKCIVCGHIYDDAKEEVKFEDLPDDWECPVCGVGKNMFKKVEK